MLQIRNDDDIQSGASFIDAGPLRCAGFWKMRGNSVCKYIGLTGARYMAYYIKPCLRLSFSLFLPSCTFLTLYPKTEHS